MLRHRPCAAELALPLALVAFGCRTPDPLTEVELRNLETHWAVDPAVGETQHLAPVARFRLVNKAASSRSIQTMATFRRKGEGPSWSSAWQSVSPLPDGKPLPVGQGALVVLKPEGEGRYTYRGAPEEMFKHPDFQDVTAEVFVRIGSSAWTKVADVGVERRLGAHAVEAFK
jgi:hypothetical protein